jgi:hypothetical protein
MRPMTPEAEINKLTEAVLDVATELERHREILEGIWQRLAATNFQLEEISTSLKQLTRNYLD